MRVPGRSIALICVVIFLLAVNSGFADMRPFEPVVITGADLPEVFMDVPVGELHLYAFLYGGGWYPVLLQIDERTADGSYFEEDDGLLDANDELVFQPQEGGASVENSQWIDDAESRTYHRAVIEIHDAVEEEYLYLYLYRSSTIEDNLDPYMEYNEAEDEIHSENYLIGHNEDAIWDECRFWIDMLNDWSPDIVDREKLRYVGDHVLIGEWILHDGDVTLLQNNVKAGPVRVIKSTQWRFGSQPISFTTTSTRHYYNNYIIAPGEPHDISNDLGLEFIRRSVDFEPYVESLNLTISDALNEELVVDGVPDEDVVTFMETEPRWFRFDAGSHVITGVEDFTSLGNETNIYYYDNEEGGTGDGTDDTGDGVSYGDYGSMISDFTYEEGEITIVYYVMNVLQGDVEGATALEYFNQPFETSAISEVYINGVDDDDYLLPETHLIAAIYPNPFNPETRIVIAMEETAILELKVFDTLGREVMSLASGVCEAGYHEYILNADGLSSGNYFLRATTSNGLEQVQKITLMQ